MYGGTHAASGAEDNHRSQFFPLAVWDSSKELKLSVLAACASLRISEFKSFKTVFPARCLLRPLIGIHLILFVCFFNEFRISEKSLENSCVMSQGIYTYLRG